MKRYLILFVMTVVMICCKTNHNPDVIEKWPNGNPKVIKQFTNKTENSFIYKELYKDGNVKSHQIFINGKNDSTSKYFDENGYLTLEKIYSKGVLQRELSYRNGKLNGPEKIYHNNGQLWTERILKNGKPWEVVSNFDSTGKSMDAGTLKDGFGTLNLYDDKGVLTETKTYYNGQEVVRDNQEKKQ